MNLEASVMEGYLGKLAYMVEPFVFDLIGPLKHGVSISKVEVCLNTFNSLSSIFLAWGVSSPLPSFLG